jgi:hypothetical protein
MAVFTVNAYAEGIDYDRLVESIIQVESGGNSQAYNKRSGCIGLMQINPDGALKEFNQNNYLPSETGISYLKTYNKYELYNPSVNIEIGRWYLHRIAEHYLKDIDKRIAYVKETKEILICDWKSIDNPDFLSSNRTIDISKYSIYSNDDYKISLICAAYNAGIGRLRKCNYDINCMPAETRLYIRKVLRIYKQKEVSQ